MRKALLVSLFVTTSLLAQAETVCKSVGGTILTNFVDQSNTFGSVTGDLSGGIGVTVLSFTPNSNGTLTFINQHRWVTTSGDTITTEPAVATGFPTGIAGLYAASYTEGLVVTGGTGRFHKSSGKIRVWGAVDINKSEVILRYEGSVCLVALDPQ